MINIIVSGAGEYPKPCYIRLWVTEAKTAPASGSSELSAPDNMAGINESSGERETKAWWGHQPAGGGGVQCSRGRWSLSFQSIMMLVEDRASPPFYVVMLWSVSEMVWGHFWCSAALLPTLNEGKLKILQVWIDPNTNPRCISRAFLLFFFFVPIFIIK